MKSYDNPEFRSYHLGQIDFGTPPTATSIPVPAWAEGGRIVGANVTGATEAFTADTTGAELHIGTAADPDKFYAGTLGVIALTDSAEFAGFLDAGLAIHTGYDGDAGAALTQLEVVAIAPTGGTPGGIALVDVAIAWY